VAGEAGRRSAASHAANAGTNISGAGGLYPIEAWSLPNWTCCDGARSLIQWASGRFQYISDFESLQNPENWIAGEAQNWLNALNTQL